MSDNDDLIVGAGDEEEAEMTDEEWNDLEDDEKQIQDEDRLLEELRLEMDSDPDGAAERAQDLGYTEGDLM
jgi:hypothetical protein